MPTIPPKQSPRKKTDSPASCARDLLYTANELRTVLAMAAGLLGDLRRQAARVRRLPVSR